MRLLINTASTFKGGSVQVAKSFLRECIRLDDCQFGVVLGPGLSHLIHDEEYPEKFRFFRLDYRPAQRVLSFQRAAKDLEKIESVFMPHAVFTTSGPSYWRPRAAHLMGFNLAHNLYPDSPYFTSVVSVPQRMRWWAKSTLIRHYTKGYADAWVVQTDDVNQRLRRWIASERVYTVSNTVSAAYLAAQHDECGESDSRHDGIKVFNLLVLSSYYRHKNLEILNGIICLLRERGINDIRFTMTLPDQDFENTISPQNRDWIDNVGPQPPDNCPALYKKSDALFMPSLLECFSANYVEAMAMKRPIITTNLGFARTICADAALYYEPLSADSALERILDLRANKQLYANLVRAGQMEFQRFGTPDQRAKAYVSLCRELAEGNCLPRETC